jgi:hypothetical protein
LDISELLLGELGSDLEEEVAEIRLVPPNKYQNLKFDFLTGKFIGRDFSFDPVTYRFIQSDFFPKQTLVFVTHNGDAMGFRNKLAALFRRHPELSSCGVVFANKSNYLPSGKQIYKNSNGKPPVSASRTGFDLMNLPFIESTSSYPRKRALTGCLFP